jgi:hypothetical protein
MSSLFVPIIRGQLEEHDGPTIRFFGISLPEIALEGGGKSWLGGVIKPFGIGRKLPIPERLLCDPAAAAAAAALANGSASNLEVSNNIMTIIPIMPIFAVRINLFVVKVYNVCIVIILATVLLA